MSKLDVTGTGATFSSHPARYRYTLWRDFGGEGRSGTTVFCMLNPSTATAEVNDPTVRRCMGFAWRWGSRRLVVVNIFALRSTDPSLIYSAQDPIGSGNDEAILGVCTTPGVTRVVCAWGRHGAHQGRGEAVAAMLVQARLRLHAMKLTADGIPYHPLYLKNDTSPIIWKEPPP